VADGENATMERNELAIVEPTLDLAFSQAALDQLTPRHNAVLLLRQRAKHEGRFLSCNAFRLWGSCKTLHLLSAGWR